MIVTHLLQVLGFVAMEPPASFSAKALLDETVRVADSLRPIRSEDVVYGQYDGYRNEHGVAADSQTETFVAARVWIDNPRWMGDPGGISTRFLAKIPGPAMELGPAQFTFDYKGSFTNARQLEAYERLIHDALIGDRTLFTRADAIERLWEVSAPLLNDPPRPHPYLPGSWGPRAADRLIAPRRWQLPQAEPEHEARLTRQAAGAVADGRPRPRAGL
jgi:glucose-6-phosphate 1-dehydrogenase